jgi:F5/8 type C domain
MKRVFIPAYYPQEDTTSRNALVQGQLDGLIVANFSPAGPGSPGPGTAYDQTNDDWITALDQWWTDDLVMGYVDNPYDPTGANLLFQQEQIRNWSQWYHVDGIMFDDSQRDFDPTHPGYLTDDDMTADISRMQHLVLYANANAHYPGIPGALIGFNWGEVNAKMERYVWCAQQIAAPGSVSFGTAETTEADYQSAGFANAWNSSDAQWVQEYSPSRFFHLVYSADPAGSGVAADVSLSRARNAGLVLITDGGMTVEGQASHHWAQLPGRAATSIDPAIPPTDLFSQEFTATRQTTAEFPDRTAHTQNDVCPPHELQIGGVATESSDPFGGSADRAIDSNTSGNWYDNSVTHTDYEFQPWWQVDLGATSFVSTVDVYNRTDCCGDRLTNFNVMVSQDGANWTTFNYPGQGGSPTTVTINTSARYVRIQLVGSNYLSLAEVKVWTP